MALMDYRQSLVAYLTSKTFTSILDDECRSLVEKQVRYYLNITFAHWQCKIEGTAVRELLLSKAS